MKTSAIKIISLCHFFCLAFFMTLSAQHVFMAHDPGKHMERNLQRQELLNAEDSTRIINSTRKISVLQQKIVTCMLSF